MDDLSLYIEINKLRRLVSWSVFVFAWQILWSWYLGLIYFTYNIIFMYSELLVKCFPGSICIKLAPFLTEFKIGGFLFDLYVWTDSDAVLSIVFSDLSQGFNYITWLKKMQVHTLISVLRIVRDKFTFGFLNIVL